MNQTEKEEKPQKKKHNIYVIYFVYFRYLSHYVFLVLFSDTPSCIILYTLIFIPNIGTQPTDVNCVTPYNMDKKCEQHWYSFFNMVTFGPNMVQIVFKKCYLKFLTLV